ncbi:hypothetical protein HQ585_05315 [candidate division KSB1 bacterium]|nr:hypothetical protein [candidate division KSB1 bacterium]
MRFFSTSGVFIHLIMFGFVVHLNAQGNASHVGFVDQNRDGLNDWFQDANGDGVNDVDGHHYPHAFRFEDQDQDGINDLWADSDGDGVNDRLSEIQKKNTQWVDRDGDGMQDPARPLRGRALKAHVLDVDGDGRNDITQQKYSGSDLGGYQYGNIAEESGMEDPNYRDLDGDGMNDNAGSGQGQGRSSGQEMDQFIDRDGDGMADDRGLGRFANPDRGKGKSR